MSVVVPTRDRPAALRRCLAALARQTGLSDLDIVVVDDGSHPTEAAQVRAAVAGTPGARLVRTPGGGPAAARNAGAAHATSPVVCFTDDDCEPVPEWAAAIAGALDHHGADAAVGRARSAPRLGPAARAWQAICDHLTATSHDPATGRVGFGPSCTLACRTEVMRAVPFDERYPLAAGEDRDWCARVTGRGLALVFVPGAIVDHHHPLPVRAFWHQQLRYGRGAHRFRDAHRDRRTEPPRFYAELLRRGFRDGPATGSLVALAQVAAAAGFALEAARAGRSNASAISS